MSLHDPANIPQENNSTYTTDAHQLTDDSAGVFPAGEMMSDAIAKHFIEGIGADGEEKSLGYTKVDSICIDAKPGTFTNQGLAEVESDAFLRIVKESHEKCAGSRTHLQHAIIWVEEQLAAHIGDSSLSHLRSVGPAMGFQPGARLGRFVIELPPACNHIAVRNHGIPMQMASGALLSTAASRERERTYRLPSPEPSHDEVLTDNIFRNHGAACQNQARFNRS